MSKGLTKAQLVDKCDQLKAALLSAKEQLEEAQKVKQAKSDKLEESAYGIYLTDNLKYKLVHIKYNAISGEATVDSVEDVAANNGDYAIAHMVLRQVNTEVVMDNCSKKWEKLR